MTNLQLRHPSKLLTMAQLKEVITKKHPVDVAQTSVDESRHSEANAPLGKQTETLNKTELQQMLDSGEWHTVEEARQLSLKHIDEVWRK